MVDRSADWLKQAERNLDVARLCSQSEFHEWACFISQQAAELAVKGVSLYLHGETVGHAISRLLTGLSDDVSVPPELLDASKSLDRHYEQARYPSAFPVGAPHDYYTRKDAQEALRHAEEIVQFCRGTLSS